MHTLWINWAPWELFPFFITSHLAPLHQHLQGLCYHRLQGLHNLKIIYIKQDDIFTRQGTIGRARLQMTVLVTKIRVEFNYLRTVHVAPICISKSLKYQHLHSLFRVSLAQPVRHTGSSSPTLQLGSKRERHTYFLPISLNWVVPSGQKSREMQLQTHRDPGCWGRQLSQYLTQYLPKHNSQLCLCTMQ